MSDIKTYPVVGALTMPDKPTVDHPFLSDPRRPLCCLDCGGCEESHKVDKSAVPMDEELDKLGLEWSDNWHLTADDIATSFKQVRDRTREATLLDEKKVSAFNLMLTSVNPTVRRLAERMLEGVNGMEEFMTFLRAAEEARK